MPHKTIVQYATEDINGLEVRMKPRIIGWFETIDRAAFARGYTSGREQPASGMTKHQMVLVLEGLKLRRQELERQHPGMKLEAIDQIIDLERHLADVLCGVPHLTET